MEVKAWNLIQDHLGLIEACTRKYYWSYKVGESKEIYKDRLEDIAWLAIIKAAETYDPTKGTIFSTWAIQKINFAIKADFRKTLGDKGIKYNYMEEMQFLDSDGNKINIDFMDETQLQSDLLIEFEAGKIVDECLKQKLSEFEMKAVILNKAQGISVEKVKLILNYKKHRNTLERKISDALSRLKKCMHSKGYDMIENAQYNGIIPLE